MPLIQNLNLSARDLPIKELSIEDNAGNTYARINECMLFLPLSLDNRFISEHCLRLKLDETPERS